MCLCLFVLLYLLDCEDLDRGVTDTVQTVKIVGQKPFPTNFLARNNL